MVVVVVAAILLFKRNVENVRMIKSKLNSLVGGGGGGVGSSQLGLLAPFVQQ